MNPVRWIVGLALLPRALHTAWISLVVLGVLLWVVMPATCSALVGSSPLPAVDAGTLETAIRDNMSVAVGSYSAQSVLEYGPPAPEPVCFIADLKSYCCPAYCQAKGGAKFEKASAIFEGCAAGLCGKERHPGHIVCNCPAKPAK